MNQPLPCLPAFEPDAARRPPVRSLLDHSGATAGGSWRWQLGGLRHRLAAQGWGSCSRAWGPARPAALAFSCIIAWSPPSPARPAPTWNVTPARFRAQIQGLLARGYRPWPLRKVLAYHDAGQSIPPQTFVVTFDDGYENVYQQAFPVLREHDVPATVFLATAYLDSHGPFPFDDWPCAGAPGVPAETWRPLTTAQCEEMLASGLVELGSHTHVHADFRNRPEDFRRDLAALARGASHEVRRA